MIQKPCFENNTEMMAWQEINCKNCKKGIFYNDKLKKMPLYKCAIQRDIEAQATGTKNVSQYAFDSVQGKKCAMLRSKNEEESIQVKNFAKGKSLVRENNTSKPVIIEPEKKAQPVDPIIAKVAKETGASIEEVQEAEIRVLDKIFKGKMISGIIPGIRQPLNENRFKQQVKGETAQMLETFTWDENMMIAFVPLIISHLAWIYAQRVLDYCGKNKISEVKKLTRSVREMRQRYVDELAKDLDINHITRIENQTEQFFKECANDFTVLWWGCNSQIKKVAPDMTHETMRTDVYCCMMMIKLLKRHNQKINKVIADKLGKSHSIDNQHMVGLSILMDAYFPDGFKVEVNNEINTSLKVLANRLGKIEFGIKD